MCSREERAGWRVLEGEWANVALTHLARCRRGGECARAPCSNGRYIAVHGDTRRVQLYSVQSAEER